MASSTPSTHDPGIELRHQPIFGSARRFFRSLQVHIVQERTTIVLLGSTALESDIDPIRSAEDAARSSGLCGCFPPAFAVGLAPLAARFPDSFATLSKGPSSGKHAATVAGSPNTFVTTG